LANDHLQAAHVKRLFAAAEEEHAIALKSFKQQAAEQEASDDQWHQLQVSERICHSFDAPSEAVFLQCRLK